MKFKNYIETESGIKDTSTSPGTAGQVLSSTVAGTSWIDQSTLVSGSAERVSILVKNAEGTALVKGDPVYIIGSVGASARLEVGLCDASDPSKMPCVGLLEQDLLNNGQGTAVTAGKLRNLITTPIDGQTTTENDTIYVKAGGSSGLALTTTKPTGSTNLIQNVGQVGRVSASSDGNLVVSAIMRTNDVPNLPEGRIWVGDGNTIVSDTVYLDEVNERMGIGTSSPQEKLHIYSTVAGPVRAEIESTQAADAVLKYTNSNRSYGTFLTQGGQFSIYDYNAASHRFYMLTNGNVGIGTTSPSYKLDVDGAARFGDNQGILLTDDSGTSYVRALNNHLNLRTTRDEDDIYFSTGTTTTTKMFIQGDTGNVGIGTTSPNEKLVVRNGTASTDVKILAYNSAAGTEATLRFSTIASETNYEKAAIIARNAAASFGRSDMHFALDSVADSGNVQFSDTKMTILNGGNVGIGTTSPAKKLTIGGIGIGNTDGLKIEDPSNAAYGAHFSFDDGSTTVEIGGVTNNTLNDCISIARDATRTITIDTSERVGIGTTTPRTKLHVSGLTGDDDPALGSSTAPLFISNTANSYGLNVGVNNVGASWLQAQSNTSSTAYEMSLNPLGGNVGVGQINPSYKLDVNGSLGCTSFEMGNLKMFTSFGSIFINGTTSGNTIFYGAPASFTQNLQVNGTVTCVNLVQTSQTDKKKDISNIDKSKAKTIQFKEYKYKEGDGDRKRYGVLVEDLENDYPELVHVGADGVKGINYIDLLVKRVAELEKELEDISLTPGAQGPQGPAGSNGKDGSVGATGPQGSQGATGATGATGAAGTNGTNGKNGADGNSHLSNVTSIAFNPKANRLEVNIGGTVYNFAPSK